jgi:hypothetical protein
MSDLVSVMTALYESEINSSFSSFWDGGFTLALGDEMNGYKEATIIYPGDGVDAEDWLHEAALNHYPMSKYACEAAGRPFVPIDQANDA